MTELVADASKVWVKCKCCKIDFQARIADRNRGWGKFCNKSCKAKEQERRTGQYKSYLCNRINGGSSRNEDPYREDIDYEGPGWDAHKDSF